MDKREFIKRTLDSNAFRSTQSEATDVNPNYWDFQLREFQSALLVVTPIAEVYDFRNSGADYRITVADAPSAAAALVETDDVTVSAFSSRYVTFTPSEYGASYQITRKEAVRAFFNVAERMTRNLAYSMALKKDNLAVSTCQSGTGNSVIVNGKSALTDLSSTDTITLASIVSAIKENEADAYYGSEYLIINHTQKQQLLNLTQLQKANEFGTRDVIQKGVIGEIFGLKVVVSPSVIASNNVAKALVISRSASGEMAFGYAIKRDPIIEKEYHALGRYWDIVGHEEYDFKVLHPNGICTIATYS